ncbi:MULTISPECIES: DUF4328 domain-containing protein [Streptacidiphilus]|uniref:DUF4328 domain-containing protein n=1 Tax=Streptacidiphilus cavernicola TaxID=3342716 RepID=A0ABV6UQG2_9ACTN|nr:DUF4328 domain-containing protein [Streptacidiphilus jeojiense]
MPCPSCSSPYLDPYGRCSACGWGGAQPPPSAYYPVAYTVPTAPTGLALAVQILFAVGLLVSLLFVGLDGYGLALSHSIAADGSGSHLDAATATDGGAALLLVLELLLVLGTAVTFIIWFFRSARLSAVLAPGQQRLSPGWAIGGWFVPLAYLVLPRLVAGDIWRAAEPLAEQPVRRPRTLLVTFWWLTFALSQLVFALPYAPLAMLMRHSNELGDDISVPVSTAWFVWAFVIGALRIAAAVLGILMVRRVTSRQQVRIMQGPGTGHPYSMAAAMQAPVYGTAPVPPAPAVEFAKPAAEPVPVEPAAVEPADAVPADAVPADAVPGQAED